ncbi:MAG TPA: hypothetical protein VM056_00710 [Terriglobales bacterium]|nr:hypothetical protein [Terriglobales bacterium]
MRKTLVLSLVAGLAISAAAQTSTSTQTTGSATNQTSVDANKSGAKIDSKAKATGQQNNSATSTGKTGTQAVDSKVAGSATNQTSGALNIPEGTKIPAVLSKGVDSKKNKEGDRIEAKTVADVVSQGKVIVPKNSKLIGRVTEAKAKSNGAAESKLGFVFDTVMMKNGQTMPLRANVQAIGAAVVQTMASLNTGSMDSNTGAMGSGAGTASGSAGRAEGGLLGGATGTAGSAAGGVAGTAGGVGDAAGTTVGGVGSTVGSTIGTTAGTTVDAAGNTVSGRGVLNSSSTGVVGLKDLQLASATSADAGASVVTSSGKSVKLDGGSQLLLSAAATR